MIRTALKRKLTLRFFSALALSWAGVAQERRERRRIAGRRKVRADAYYGVQTARALENFKIFRRAHKSLPGRRGMAMVSWPPPRANTDVAR